MYKVTAQARHGQSDGNTYGIYCTSGAKTSLKTTDRIRKLSMSIVNTWNSLPHYVVRYDTI